MEDLMRSALQSIADTAGVLAGELESLRDDLETILGTRAVSVGEASDTGDGSTGPGGAGDAASGQGAGLVLTEQGRELMKRIAGEADQADREQMLRERVRVANDTLRRQIDPDDDSTTFEQRSDAERLKKANDYEALARLFKRKLAEQDVERFGVAGADVAEDDGPPVHTGDPQDCAACARWTDPANDPGHREDSEV